MDSSDSKVAELELLSKVKKQILMLDSGSYLSMYTRICILHAKTLAELKEYITETSEFYKPLYKDPDHDPLNVLNKCVELSA